MAEKVTLKLSAAAAVFVRVDTPKPDKLRAARGEVPLAPADFGNLLLFLRHDPDPDIREAAIGCMRDIPASLRKDMVAAPEIHPKVIELLSRLAPSTTPVPEQSCNPAAGTLLSDSRESSRELPSRHPDQNGATEDVPLPDEAMIVEGDVDGETETLDEETEEYKSKYKLCMELEISEKIKYALTGDKEWRTILIKDSNKLVSGAVIKNPRITEGEVLTIVKSKIQNDEILRIICMNKDWLKNYQIRKALVENAKTPLPKSLRFLSTLTQKDLSSLAKSKNIPSAVSSQARKLIMTRK